MHKFVFLCILVSSCIVSQTSVSVVCVLCSFLCFMHFVVLIVSKTSVSVVYVFSFFMSKINNEIMNNYRPPSSFFGTSWTRN